VKAQYDIVGAAGLGKILNRQTGIRSRELADSKLTKALKKSVCLSMNPISKVDDKIEGHLVAGVIGSSKVSSGRIINLRKGIGMKIRVVGVARNVS